MVAGRLSLSDPFEISLPQSASQSSPSTQELVILLGADGQLAVDGDVMSAEEMKLKIADQLSRDPSAKLRLKADADAEAVEVVVIMEILRDAGVETLELLTVQGGS